MGLRHGVRHFTEETRRVETVQEARKSMEYIMDKIRRHNRSEVSIENDYDGTLDLLTIGKYRYYIDNDVLVEEYVLDDEGNTNIVELNKFVSTFQITDIQVKQDENETEIVTYFVISLGTDGIATESPFQIDTEIHLRGD